MRISFLNRQSLQRSQHKKNQLRLKTDQSAILSRRGSLTLQKSTKNKHDLRNKNIDVYRKHPVIESKRYSSQKRPRKYNEERSIRNPNISKQQPTQVLEKISTKAGRPRFFSNLRATNSFNPYEKAFTSQLNKVKYPISGAQAKQKYQHLLNQEQRKEIGSVTQIWYLGEKCQHSKRGLKDDRDGKFKRHVGDHVGFRYQLIMVIGSGSFGRVYKAFDHKDKNMVALKIVKAKQKCTRQAQIEQKIIRTIAQNDKNDDFCIVKAKHFFYFLKHVCFTFQLLSYNLYEVSKINFYKRLPDDILRRFALQILNSLMFLSGLGIIHCDLKPQNILLKEQGKAAIKLIDFGSSCKVSQIIHNYIQSRYYRAPEIILGYPYSLEIDMWSLGAILAQLFLGTPLFPGQNQSQQIINYAQKLGAPPVQYLAATARGDWYFEGSEIKIYDIKGKIRQPLSMPLEIVMAGADLDFVDFIRQCLEWVPERRMRPIKAMQHTWIHKGLPSQVLQYQESKQQEWRAYQKESQKFYHYGRKFDLSLDPN